MMRELHSILIKTKYALGDDVVLTANIKDLWLNFPHLQIYVSTTYKDVWASNYLLASSVMPKDVTVIDFHYRDLMQTRKIREMHYITASLQELSKVIFNDEKVLKQFTFVPDLYLNNSEEAITLQGLINKLKNTSLQLPKKPVYAIDSGGKADLTTKLLPPNYYQKIVDTLKDQITFIQLGAKQHNHPALKNVINLVGKTNIRELITLISKVDGIIAPFTSFMHIGAAFNKKLFILGGGREDFIWNEYPNQKIFSKIGQLDCCETKACWKARVVPLKDDREKANASLCKYPVKVADLPFNAMNINNFFARCMVETNPDIIIEEIRKSENL